MSARGIGGDHRSHVAGAGVPWVVRRAAIWLGERDRQHWPSARELDRLFCLREGQAAAAFAVAELIRH